MTITNKNSVLNAYQKEITEAHIQNEKDKVVLYSYIEELLVTHRATDILEDMHIIWGSEE